MTARDAGIERARSGRTLGGMGSSAGQAATSRVGGSKGTGGPESREGAQAAALRPASDELIDDSRERETDRTARSSLASEERAEGAPESSVRVGDRLGGKYQIVDVLSEGGMGTLFVALNVDLDVPVAVKLIHSAYRGQQTSYLGDRLLREARVAAGLGHPAIIKVFDVGHAESGQPYIVMELLEGEDLRAAMDRHGRITPSKAVRCLLPIAHALSTAHGHEVVHRDIKPANIFLADTATGQVQPKLIDFGLAKTAPKKGRRLTWAGATIGTPDYMAPEQALGQDVTAAADIWSLCVVLYEMVTGTTPFSGKNHIALLHAIVEDEPAPFSEHGIDAGRLWSIVARGLAKSPGDRWASMQDFGAALARWLIGAGVRDDVCGAPLARVWLAGRRKSPGDIFRTGEFKAQDGPQAAGVFAAPASTAPDEAALEPSPTAARSGSGASSPGATTAADDGTLPETARAGAGARAVEARAVPSRRGGSMTPVVVALESSDTPSGLGIREESFEEATNDVGEPLSSQELGELPTMPATTLRDLDPDGATIEQARLRAQQTARSRQAAAPIQEEPSFIPTDPRVGPLASSARRTSVPSVLGICFGAIALVVTGMVGTWRLLGDGAGDAPTGAGSAATEVASSEPSTEATGENSVPPSEAPSASTAVAERDAGATADDGDPEAASSAKSVEPGTKAEGRVPRPAGAVGEPTARPQAAATGQSVSDYLPPTL